MSNAHKFIIPNGGRFFYPANGNAFIMSAQPGLHTNNWSTAGRAVVSQQPNGTGPAVNYQYPSGPSPAPPRSPPTPKELEPQLMVWEEFSKLFPNLPAERPESGDLPDGRFFTQKNPRRDHYLLFGSKKHYIANFVHYYFSESNLSKDKTLQKLLVEGGVVLIDDLLHFPKLKQVSTTIDDMVSALQDSNKVLIVSLVNNKLGVRRIDGWYPGVSGPESSPASTTWSESSGSSGQHSSVASPPAGPPTPSIFSLGQTGGLHTVTLAAPGPGYAHVMGAPVAGPGLTHHQQVAFGEGYATVAGQAMGAAGYPPLVFPQQHLWNGAAIHHQAAAPYHPHFAGHHGYWQPPMTNQ